MAKRKWADLAAWYFGDDKNEVEAKTSKGTWVITHYPEFDDDREYRKKERKFNEGEWYPVILKENDRPYVMVYDEGSFRRTTGGIAFNTSDLSFIDESLGKLNFGGVKMKNRFSSVAITKLNQLVARKDFDKFIFAGKDENVAVVLKFKGGSACMINSFGRVTWENEHE